MHTQLSSEGKTPLWKCKHRWEDHIKINLEIGHEDMDWMQLVQDSDQLQAVVNMVMNKA
jgi:hypothetical protein